MPLWAYAFEDIAESHLRAIDTNDVPESHRLEFKRESYKNGDGNKEFLKDVSALANLSGGHIVIGLDERESTGKRLIGIDGDADQEIARLENIARSGLDPRLSELRMRPISLGGGRNALVIRVPWSWNAPHRVIVGGSNRFYIRNSNGVHEMSLSELRTAFTLGASVMERVAGFRQQRVQAIKADETPVSVQGPSRLVIHVIPLSSITSNTMIEMSVFDRGQMLFPPPVDGSLNATLNFDGYVSMASPDVSSGAYWTYAQVFRNGIVEAVIGDFANPRPGEAPFFPVPEAEARLLWATEQYVRSLGKLGITPPYAVALSALQVSGTIYIPPGVIRPRGPLNREDLLFAPAVLDTGNLTGNWKAPLKPIAEALWNSFGYLRPAIPI